MELSSDALLMRPHGSSIPRAQLQDEDPEEEEEKPVPQFAIYGPHLVPLAEAVTSGDGSAG